MKKLVVIAGLAFSAVTSQSMADQQLLERQMVEVQLSAG